jgi:uncharacterized protein (DUF305 family)
VSSQGAIRGSRLTPRRSVRSNALAAIAALAAAGCAGRSAARSGALPSAGAPAILSPAAQARADSGRPAYSAADVRFMSGMISHHAQAVVMAGWAPSHGASPSVRGLCERIVVAQRDEIALMQRWLRERHEVVPESDPRGMPMPGMDHPMLMPGMLTPAQMGQLDGARGGEFDRLFLEFMIQHHQGALTMVDELFGANGAAQDGVIFKFASDVSADQTTEIDRMNTMLSAMPSGGRSP